MSKSKACTITLTRATAFCPFCFRLTTNDTFTGRNDLRLTIAGLEAIASDPRNSPEQRNRVWLKLMNGARK